jgi:hypothetical protein
LKTLDIQVTANDFDVVLSQTEENVAKARRYATAFKDAFLCLIMLISEESELSVFSSFYAQVRSVSHTNSVCGLCERSFETESALNTFLRNMDKKITDTPQNLEKAKKSLEINSDLLNRLKSVQPRFLEYQQIRASDIPSIMDQLVSQQRIESESKILHDDISQQQENTQTDQGDLKEILRKVDEVDKKRTEEEGLRQDVQRMLEELDILGEASTSVEEISQGLRDCQEIR